MKGQNMSKCWYLGSKLFSLKVKFSKKGNFCQSFCFKRLKCVKILVLKVKIVQFKGQILKKVDFCQSLYC